MLCCAKIFINRALHRIVLKSTKESRLKAFYS
jgi:hypothetical protein